MEILEQILRSRIDEIQQMRIKQIHIQSSDLLQNKKTRTIFLKFKKNQVMRVHRENQIITYASRQFRFSTDNSKIFIQICKTIFFKLHNISAITNNCQTENEQMCQIIKLFVKNYNIVQEQRKQIAMKNIIQNIEMYDFNLLIITLLNLLIETTRTQFHKILSQVLQKLFLKVKQCDQNKQIQKKIIKIPELNSLSVITQQNKIKFLLKNLKNPYKEFLYLFHSKIRSYHSQFTNCIQDLDQKYYKSKFQHNRSEIQSWLQSNIQNVVNSIITIKNSDIKNSISAYKNSYDLKYKNKRKSKISLILTKSIKQKKYDRFNAFITRNVSSSRIELNQLNLKPNNSITYHLNKKYNPQGLGFIKFPIQLENFQQMNKQFLKYNFPYNIHKQNVDKKVLDCKSKSMRTLIKKGIIKISSCDKLIKNIIYY